MKTDHYGQVMKNPDGSTTQEDVITGLAKETPSSGSERRLVRLAVFVLRSGLFLTLLALVPLWLPVWLVLANIGDYWEDEMSRWFPAWWKNARKAWHGSSLPNAEVSHRDRERQPDTRSTHNQP